MAQMTHNKCMQSDKALSGLAFFSKGDSRKTLVGGNLRPGAAAPAYKTNIQKGRLLFRHNPLLFLLCDPVLVDKLYAWPGHDGVCNSLHIGKLVR